MKSFKVTSIHNAVGSEIKIALDLRFGSCHHWTVTGLPEIEKKETGILMSPREITHCDQTTCIDFKKYTSDYSLTEDCVSIGRRLEISKLIYPRAFYKEIKVEWDFDSVPVGSLIRCNLTSGGFNIGYLTEPIREWIILKYSDDPSKCLKLNTETDFKSIVLIEQA